MDTTKTVLASGIFEFLGTLLYVFLGCSTAMVVNLDYPSSTMAATALSFGLSYTVLVHISSPWSCGYLNPAVTVAMMINKKISIARGVCYIAFQLLGAMAGASLLYAVTPTESHHTLGANQLGHGVSPIHGVSIEAILTLIMVYTVLMTWDISMSDAMAAIWAGIVVTVCHLAGLHLTGCGINPARSLGPAFITHTWDNHWVYWVGPTIGSVLAASLHLCSRKFQALCLASTSSLSIQGEGIDLHVIDDTSRKLSLRGSEPLPQRQDPESPSLARAAVPQEIKTYL